MATCSWVEPATLRLHLPDGEIDIPMEHVEMRSPHHLLVVNESSLIKAEILVGLNEIMVQHNHVGYQFPMNEQVRTSLEGYATKQ